jgi:hypothetical protein
LRFISCLREINTETAWMASVDLTVTNKIMDAPHYKRAISFI